MDEILEHLIIGRIGKPHGVQGEVSVELMTDFPERFQAGARIFIGPEYGAAPVPLTIATARPHQGRMLVRFEATADRTAAEQLRGMSLFIPIDEAAPLDEDSYYPHELIGLTVRLEDGRELGLVDELIQAGGNDVLVIRSPERKGDVLVPLAGPFIQAIDLDEGVVTVVAVEGLLS